MSNPPLSSSDLTTILESDLWGLQEFNQELQDIDELVKQCDAIKSRIQKIESTVGMRLSSSMLFVLYQKHREKSLKKQILSAIERTIPKIIYVEESIRLWLEAIVMKKWSMRHEAFQHFHHMDLVIKMYKKYLNDNIERLNECNEVLLGIKEFIRQRKHELDFIDVLALLKEFELWKFSNSNPSSETIQSDPLDTNESFLPLDEYSKPSRLPSIDTRTSSSQWDGPCGSNWQKAPHDENYREDTLIFLQKAIDLLSRLKTLRKEIKKSQKHLLMKLSDIRELRDDLQSQCGSQIYLPNSWDDDGDHLSNSKNIVKRDIKKILQQDCYDSDGEIQDLHPRHTLNNILPVLLAPKNVIQVSKNLYKNLQMLESLQNKAKESLERAISQKNDLILLKSEINATTEAESQKQPSISVSPVYDIIWGMYCVPAPNVTQEKVFYCRSLVKTREFPLQAFANDFIGTSSTSMNIEHHSSSLSYLSGLLKKENLDLLRARHLIAENLIYLKEFTFAELGTIQAQLRAETLRIHTVQDKFAANWAAEHPSRVSADKIAISDEISESESIDSRDSRVRHSRADSKSFSRPRSRANSWSSRCDSQSSLLGRLTASVLSLIDSDSHKVLQAESFYPESPCGCGIIWEGKSLEKSFHCYHDTSAGYYAAIGLLGAIGVFSRTLAYEDLLSAFALRDMLSTDHGVHLPLLVFSPHENTFIGLEPKLQHVILAEFLNECSPHPCDCSDFPCTFPTLPHVAPPSMRINLPFYPNLSSTQQIRLHGAWGCSNNFLTNIYPISPPVHTQEIETYLFYGLSEAVYSANVDAANAIIQAAAFCLFKFPDFTLLTRSCQPPVGSRPDFVRGAMEEGEDVYVSLKDVPSSVISGAESRNVKFDSMTPVYPLEHLVQTIQRLIDQFNAQVPQSQLLIPLGALRVIQASVHKQISFRFDEACLALARWIDLSNSVAFRVLGAAHTSVAQAQALGTIIPLAVPGCGSSTVTNEPHMLVAEKKKALEHTRERKAPLIASVAVSCRVELYHDLLSAQISATAGKACSDTIFSNNADWSQFDTDRSSIQRSSEYILTPDEQVVLLEILSSLVVSLGAEVEQASKTRRSDSNTLQTIRQNIRFHVFQYLLGLDERWGFTQTLAICRMILTLIEKYRPLLSGTRFNSYEHLPFIVDGPPGELLTPCTLNIIARGLPKTLHGRNCTMRYSLERDGASVLTLIHLSEKAPYNGCLLVVQDTAGYVFGGYLDGQITGHSREYFGSGSCFVFRALPNTKIFPWSKKNDYFFCYGNDFIGMGGGSGGFAFVLDDDLRGGTSSVSATFDNDVLSFTSLFECRQVELLTFE